MAVLPLMKMLFYLMNVKFHPNERTSTFKNARRRVVPPGRPDRLVLAPNEHRVSPNERLRHAPNIHLMTKACALMKVRRAVSLAPGLP